MLFVRPGDFFNTEAKRKDAASTAKMFIQMDGMARPRDYKKMYGGLTAGDPKLRTLRAIYQDISCAYADYAKRFRKEVRQMADAICSPRYPPRNG